MPCSNASIRVGAKEPREAMSPAVFPPVPLLNLRRQTAAIREEIDAAIAVVVDHGQFILGPEVRLLEERIAEYCGTRFAVACASGSDAILLPLMALGVGRGSSVITTAYTFFATGGSISRLGATPVYLDIDPETYNLDPARLRMHLEKLTPEEIRSTRAIIPVHLFGQCADMRSINEIAGRFGIPVIEDAAQAIGAEFDGARAGGLGWCGAFSFFPSKNLGGFGDGGIVTTSDASLAENLRILRNHGDKPKYYHYIVGINSRLDTLQAAILLVKLRYLDEWTTRRRANAAAYRRLIEAGGFAEKVGLPSEAPCRKHVYNQFTVRVTDRDRVRERLTQLGVATEIYYPVPLHLQECFAGLGYRKGDLPQCEQAAREALALPIDPGLTEDEIASVVDRLATSI
jgi:dTDP-4-amino-4,6-dideoxygalactose transaminase